MSGTIDSSQLFTHTDQFLAERDRQIEAKVEAKMTALYQQAEKEKELEQKFYSANPDLKGKSALIKTVCFENASTLRNIEDEDERLNAIAGLCRNQLGSSSQHIPSELGFPQHGDPALPSESLGRYYPYSPEVHPILEGKARRQAASQSLTLEEYYQKYGKPRMSKQ